MIFKNQQKIITFERDFSLRLQRSDTKSESEKLYSLKTTLLTQILLCHTFDCFIFYWFLVVYLKSVKTIKTV